MSSLQALRKKPPALSSSSGETKDSVPPLNTSKTPKSLKSKSENSDRLKALMARRKRNAGTSSETPLGKSLGARRGARVSKTIKPAEVHFIGELSGCSGFGDGVSCRWTLDYGESWKLTSENNKDTKENKDDDDDDNDPDSAAAAAAAANDKRSLSNKLSEQTHYAYGSHYGEPVWGHPLDFQCRSKQLAGWPRLLLEVFKLDEHGRNDLVGYGVVDLPTTSGAHDLECTTWRPRGDRKTEYAAFFIGGHPRLSKTGLNVLYRDAWESRMELTTVPSGTVYLSLEVLLRNVTEESMAWVT
jgi:B9 domain-containing protein 2